MQDMREMPGVANSLIWRDGEVVDDDVSPADLEAAVLDPDTLAWVDLVAPTKTELDFIGERLGLRATAIEDALAAHERPKVTRHADHLFFTVYAAQLAHPRDDDLRRLAVSRVSGFVLPNALITVRLDDRIDIRPVVARWRDNADLLASGPGALVHGLLDTVVDGHFTTIQQLDDAIEELEDELFAERAHGREFALRIYRIRKDLVALRRVVLPMREVVGALQRHRPTFAASGLTSMRSELDSWFDDLYDHVLRASEWTESLRDLISSVFETNLSLQDQRLNDIMKQLAAWAAIIAVPTAITGWFGQNVPYPGFGLASGVWLTAGLIILCSLGLYVAFKRKGWL
ncbi:MAG: magnesium transporter CorA family protein [Dermatophilus congolensis]|nr:magnesium transporter CorA family protein [Dermatophilus congolensis]